MTRLKKAHVEALLRDYDSDPIGALTAALRVALERPSDDWLALLAAAEMTDERRSRLQTGDPATLDALAAKLNENRGT